METTQQAKVATEESRISEKNLRQSALVMRLFGWLTFPVVGVLTLLYPEGFLWGYHEGTGYHPYVWMILTLYLAWCILMVRGAKDPLANRALFDWGILANLLHGLLMGYYMLSLEHEMQHSFTDVPMLLIVAGILWRYYPTRQSGEGSVPQ